MWKRILSILLSMILMILAAGCGKNEPSDKETTPSEIEETDPEHWMEILDREGKPVGQIDARASASAADAGIFYRIWAPGMDEKTATAEYRFFRLSDQKDILLGRLEDQGYETFYSRTELNGIVYTLAVTGDPSDEKNDTLWLLAFDGEKGTMEKYAVTEYGFAYSTITLSDGKLFILNHEMKEPACSKVYQYDPADKSVKEILTLPEAAENGTDSMRSICAAEDGFYLLRLFISADGHRNLFLDRYDFSGKKISETSLNEILIPAITMIHGIMNEGDAENELGYFLTHFEVLQDRYLYYKNFAVTTLIVDLQDREAVAQDDLYSFSFGGGKRLFYHLDFDLEAEKTPEIYELAEKELKPVTFTPADAHECLQILSVSPSGVKLLEFKRSAAEAVLYLYQEP